MGGGDIYVIILYNFIEKYFFVGLSGQWRKGMVRRRKIAASQACNPLAPDAPDLIQFSTVDEWLLSLKMSRYSDNFAAAGVSSMDQVKSTTVSSSVP